MASGGADPDVVFSIEVVLADNEVLVGLVVGLVVKLAVRLVVGLVVVVAEVVGDVVGEVLKSISTVAKGPNGPPPTAVNACTVNP